MCELGIHSNCEPIVYIGTPFLLKSLFFSFAFFLALHQIAVINDKKHLAEVMQQKKNTT